jgi:hypothetical protein
LRTHQALQPAATESAARAATAVLDVALQTCDLRPQAKSIRFHLKKTVGQQDAAVPCVISGRL